MSAGETAKRVLEGDPKKALYKAQQLSKRAVELQSVEGTKADWDAFRDDLVMFALYELNDFLRIAYNAPALARAYREAEKALRNIVEMGPGADPRDHVLIAAAFLAEQEKGK